MVEKASMKLKITDGLKGPKYEILGSGVFGIQFCMGR
jgi:hypothetical protein